MLNCSKLLLALLSNVAQSQFSHSVSFIINWCCKSSPN